MSTESMAYYQSGGATTVKNQAYTTSNTDESGVKVTNGGILNLSDSSVTTTGHTTSEDNSNFYGLNAGVLAEAASQISISNCSVITSGNGANALFATGADSAITLSNVNIKTTGDSARGLDATLTGTVTANSISISTEGAHCAAFATDRGNGVITANNSVATTSGTDSPGVYSTGDITISSSTIKALGAEAAVIEGENFITLTDTTLLGAKNRGVMIYQSDSGDAEGKKGTFTMNSGSLTAQSGPLFFVTNTTAEINLTGVELTFPSAILIQAAATERWGNTGKNGGNAVFTANGEILTGDLICDSISSITATIKNCTKLTGTINSAALTLDSTSIWSVTGTSYLTSLTDGDSTLANIDDNGYTIYYDSSLTANGWLGNKSHTLTDGGKLTPKS